MEPSSLADIQGWVAEHSLSLLVFTTRDCGVCDALRPHVAALADTEPRLVVRYIDVEDSPEIAGQHEVFAVPVYVLSVNGKESVRFARHFSMDDLRSAVHRYSGLLSSE
jgi:thiol-disulfide isomerase/thioredoxin